MLETPEEGHGLQIVTVTDDHRYMLETNELKSLLLREDVKDLPVVVVSVAGAYRGGKSFLLNFFLRYLSAPLSDRQDGSWLGDDSEPLAGFIWRSGIKATTMGVLMWSKPFITTLSTGERVAILLVDTQGTFDSRSTVRDNSTVFALSTLVSSVQIYNLSHNIKEDDLQHLELFTAYGNLVNASDPKKKAFQVLEFLVRDWQFEDDYPFGFVGGERLLQEKLEITKNLADEMKKLRQHIRSCFEKVSCFLMPHPGFEVLKSKFDGSVRDIDPKFRSHLKDLTNSIFSPEKLLPKTINGERVKARDLFNYFNTYMELFNSDKIPTPSNIFEMTVKAGLLSAVSEGHDIYEKGMDAECGPKQPSVPAVDLKVLHEKYVKMAIDAFNNKKKMGSKEEADEYLQRLTKELNKRLEQFLQSNLSKLQTALINAKEEYDKVIQNISKDKPFCVHPADLENIHRTGVEAARKVFDASRKRITDKFDDERAKFLKGFERQYTFLRQTNEQNNTMAVTELKINYWQHMQLKASTEPPLTSKEFNKEHEDALKEAIDDFKNKRNRPDNYGEDVHKFNLAKGIQDSFINLKALNKSKNKTLMNEGIFDYDSYMNDHWNANQCLHPDDLDEIHREGTCRAFEKLHPKKQCSAGFDDSDEDEATLKEILSQRYQDYKKNNDNANQTAVGTAYNEYVSSIDYNCGFTVWWLFVIPYIVNLNRRDQYHEEAKNRAIAVFYGKRGASGHHKEDPYRENLDKMMEEYYKNNY